MDVAAGSISLLDSAEFEAEDVDWVGVSGKSHRILMPFLAR